MYQHIWTHIKNGRRSTIFIHLCIIKIQKLIAYSNFFYIHVCLCGEAAQVILFIEMTAANYSMTWNGMVGRYNNTKVQSHTKEFFDLPTVNKTVVQLHRIN